MTKKENGKIRTILIIIGILFGLYTSVGYMAESYVESVENKLITVIDAEVIDFDNNGKVLFRKGNQQKIFYVCNTETLNRLSKGIIMDFKVDPDTNRIYKVLECKNDNFGDYK